MFKQFYAIAAVIVLLTLPAEKILAQCKTCSRDINTLVVTCVDKPRGQGYFNTCVKNGTYECTATGNCS